MGGGWWTVPWGFGSQGCRVPRNPVLGSLVKGHQECSGCSDFHTVTRKASILPDDKTGGHKGTSREASSAGDSPGSRPMQRTTASVPSLDSHQG